MTIEYAYYADGARQTWTPASLEEAAAKPHRGGHYLWLELHDPSPEQMQEVARSFRLHDLAVEDAALAHQRPKVEAYDDFHLIIYKTARWDAERREVDFGELDIFLGKGYVIVVRHGATSDVARSRAQLEQHPSLVKTGPAAAVWSLLD